METNVVTKIDNLQIKYYDWLKFIAIIIAVVALGTLAVNQVMNYYYKAQFIQGPCQLCVKLNPEWKQCYDKITAQDMNTNSYKYNLSLP